MNKKTLIIIGSSVIGVLVLLVLILWLITLFNHKYYTYEEVENKISNAAKEYYNNNPEILPVNDGKYTLSYNTLVENGYIKQLNELLVDGDSCFAEVYVVKQNDNYSYIPVLNCEDKYQSRELYKQIILDNPLATDASGLYQAEDGTYYFKGKVNNNYIALGNNDDRQKTDMLWQIVSISPDNTIKIRSTVVAPDKTSYDTRFNVDRNSDTGYNDFEMSVLKEYLLSIEKNESVLTSKEKSKLVAKNICIAARSEDDTSKDGSTECSTLSKEPMLFSTLLPYEYMRASLDDNCLKTTDKSCANFNFLVDADGKTDWSITADTINNYQAYQFNGKYYESVKTRNRKNVFLVANISEYAFYKSGTGTIDDPYRLFKVNKSTTAE